MYWESFERNAWMNMRVSPVTNRVDLSFNLLLTLEHTPPCRHTFTHRWARSIRTCSPVTWKSCRNVPHIHSEKSCYPCCPLRNSHNSLRHMKVYVLRQWKNCCSNEVNSYANTIICLTQSTLMLRVIIFKRTTMTSATHSGLWFTQERKWIRFFDGSL